MDISITAFKKLTTAKITDLLPVNVTSNGKTIFIATNKSNSSEQINYTDDQLVQLLIGNDKDNVHVSDAKNKIDEWKKKLNLSQQVVTQPINTQNQTTINAVDYTKPYWLGEWSGDVGSAVNDIVNNADNKNLLLVAYNIPGRDNGNYSAGGLKNGTEYHNWIALIANAIKTKEATIILEPDALGLSRSLNDHDKIIRYQMLNDAVKLLKANKNTKVYVDSSTWAGIDDSVQLLQKIVGMDGFSCNVSGYDSQDSVISYASQVSNKTGLHYVVDTSRNGNGNPHPGKWCNVTDTKVGIQPTTNTNVLNCDAYLWIKVPGESDGLQINGDGSGSNRTDVPSAGTVWPEFRDAIYSGDWVEFKHKYNV